MNQEITVRITRNYGNEAIYPADKTGLTFTRLTGKKTLSRSDLELIKQLGFNINVEAPAL